MYVTSKELSDLLGGRRVSEVEQKDLEHFKGRMPCKTVKKLIEGKGLKWPE